MNTPKIRRLFLSGTALALLFVSGGNVAQAQSRRSRQEQAAKQQKNKNDWRNLATIAAGASAFGFIKDDPTLGFVGALGALYSADRYEKERKSQDKTARARTMQPLGAGCGLRMGNMGNLSAYSRLSHGEVAPTGLASNSA